MKIYKILSLLFIPLVFSSCGGASYTYSFEKGRYLDFGKGNWILNEPNSNYESERMYNIAKREFKEILEDSLVEYKDLRIQYMVPQYFPFEPTTQELKDLQLVSGADYLINIDTKLLKNEMGSFATAPSVGSRVTTNEAESTIIIYDLNNMTILSESSVHGVVEKVKNADQKKWDYVSSGGTITMKGLVRLIKRYKKYRVDD